MSKTLAMNFKLDLPQTASFLSLCAVLRSAAKISWLLDCVANPPANVTHPPSTVSADSVPFTISAKIQETDLSMYVYQTFIYPGISHMNPLVNSTEFLLRSEPNKFIEDMWDEEE